MKRHAEEKVPNLPSPPPIQINSSWNNLPNTERIKDLDDLYFRSKRKKDVGFYDGWKTRGNFIFQTQCLFGTNWKKLMAASKTIHQVVERDLMEDIVISEWNFWNNDF